MDQRPGKYSFQKRCSWQPIYQVKAGVLSILNVVQTPKAIRRIQTRDSRELSLQQDHSAIGTIQIGEKMGSYMSPKQDACKNKNKVHHQASGHNNRCLRQKPHVDWRSNSMILKSLVMGYDTFALQAAHSLFSVCPYIGAKIRICTHCHDATTGVTQEQRHCCHTRQKM